VLSGIALSGIAPSGKAPAGATVSGTSAAGHRPAGRTCRPAAERARRTGGPRRVRGLPGRRGTRAGTPEPAKAPRTPRPRPASFTPPPRPARTRARPARVPARPARPPPRPARVPARSAKPPPRPARPRPRPVRRRYRAFKAPCLAPHRFQLPPRGALPRCRSGCDPHAPTARPPGRTLRGRVPRSRDGGGRASLSARRHRPPRHRPPHHCPCHRRASTTGRRANLGRRDPGRSAMPLTSPERTRAAPDGAAPAREQPTRAHAPPRRPSW
jgi:hypothetical protein